MKKFIVRAKHVPRRYSNATRYLKRIKQGQYIFTPFEDDATKFSSLEEAQQIIADMRDIRIPKSPIHWRADALMLIQLFSLDTEDIFEGLLVPMVGKVHVEYLQVGQDIPVARTIFNHPDPNYR